MKQKTKKKHPEVCLPIGKLLESISWLHGSPCIALIKITRQQNKLFFNILGAGGSLKALEVISNNQEIDFNFDEDGEYIG